ncbi:MAG: PIN domain-containing protein [Nitrososphaerales archaeon]
MITKYVVDTNVLVHWLLKPDGLSAKIINSFTLELFTPSYAIEELTDHSKIWIQKNPRVNLNQFVDSLSAFMDIIYPPFDPKADDLANLLLKEVDPDDVPFLAVALMNCLLRELRVKIYEIDLGTSYLNFGRYSTAMADKFYSDVVILLLTKKCHTLTHMSVDG